MKRLGVETALAGDDGVRGGESPIEADDPEDLFAASLEGRPEELEGGA